MLFSQRKLFLTCKDNYGLESLKSQGNQKVCVCLSWVRSSEKYKRKEPAVPFLAFLKAPESSFKSVIRRKGHHNQVVSAAFFYPSLSKPLISDFSLKRAPSVIIKRTLNWLARGRAPRISECLSQKNSTTGHIVEYKAIRASPNSSFWNIYSKIRQIRAKRAMHEPNRPVKDPRLCGLCLS